MLDRIFGHSFNFLSTVSANNEQCQCPTGWYRILDSCIWASNEQLNFAEANIQCAQIVDDGRLFEPMNLMQNNLVGQLKTELLGKQAFCWIGLEDQDNEGEYVYHTSKQSVAFANWESYITRSGHTKYEPNGRRTENCVDMKPVGQWGDLPCNGRRCFICEKPLLL